MTDLDELREQLATIEHQRWSDWVRYVHSCCRPLGGNLVIPSGLVEQWERQAATLYDELTADEQRRDLREVDRYWPLIVKALGEARNGVRAPQPGNDEESSG